MTKCPCLGFKANCLMVSFAEHGVINKQKHLFSLNQHLLNARSVQITLLGHCGGGAKVMDMVSALRGVHLSREGRPLCTNNARI